MSNRLRTSAIDVNRKLPITKARLDFLQDNTETLASTIIKGIMGAYTTGDMIILYGCVISGTPGPGPITMTAGAIYYNGLIYQVASASFTTAGLNIPVWKIFTDLQDRAVFQPDGFTSIPAAYVQQIQTFVLVPGPVGGSGISGYVADYNSAVIKPLQPSKIIKASTEITSVTGSIDNSADKILLTLTPSSTKGSSKMTLSFYINLTASAAGDDIYTFKIKKNGVTVKSIEVSTVAGFRVNGSFFAETTYAAGDIITATAITANFSTGTVPYSILLAEALDAS